jgi:hypothetical protein
MRKITILILVLGLVFSVFNVKAQSGTELELSRFINHYHKVDEAIQGISGGWGVLSEIGVVPTGKVWKVVAAASNDTENHTITLVLKDSQDRVVFFEMLNNVLPVFITENTNVYTEVGGESNKGDGFVSIIEYTVN